MAGSVGSNFGFEGQGREIRSLFPRGFGHEFFRTLMEGRVFFVNLKFDFGNKVKVYGNFDLSKLGGFEVRKFRDRLNSYFACIDEICLQIIVRF